LQGSTSYVEAPKYSKHPEKEPLSIQFHGNPVRFRNIWIRENVQPLVGKKPEPTKEAKKNDDKKKKNDGEKKQD
jgi:hypothetical protein